LNVVDVLNTEVVDLLVLITVSYAVIKTVDVSKPDVVNLLVDVNALVPTTVSNVVLNAVLVVLLVSNTVTNVDVVDLEVDAAVSKIVA